MSLYKQSAAIGRVVENSLRPTGGAAPEGAVSLAMGEPDFDTPPVIVDAAIRALEQGWTHYGDLNGDPELRSFIALEASEESGHPIDPDSVLISHGGAAAISSSVLALVGSGDKVIIPNPTYSLYADVVRLAGGEPVFVPTNSENQLDVPALLEAAQGARLIIVCNPVNPTGAVLSAASLEELARGLTGTNTLVLADEAYAHLVYSDDFISSLSIQGLRERLVYCQTFSKTYAMTGWRIGYVISPPEIAALIKTAHRTLNGSIAAATQRAALEAIKRGPDLAKDMMEAYTQRRSYVLKRLSKMEGVEFIEPQGAFYVFFKYPQNMESTRMLQKLRDCGVLLRAGSEYGPAGEGHLRLSFAANMDTLEIALDRIEQGIAKIR